MAEKFKFRGVLKFFAVFAVLFIFVFIISGFYIKNKLSDIDFIKHIVYKNTGLVLNINDTNASFKGLSFNFYSPYVSINSNENSKPFIEAKEVIFKINILPLLQRKISFGDIYLNSFSVNVKRNKDGSFDILNYIQIQNNSFLKPDLSALNITSDGFSINFEDELYNNKILFNGDYFLSDGLDINNKFILETQGTINILSGGKNLKSDFYIDFDSQNTKNSVKVNRSKILLNGFNTSFLADYLKKYNVNSTDSIVNLSITKNENESSKLLLSLDNINYDFIYKNDKNTIKSDKPVVILSDYYFSGRDLILNSVNVLSDGINISGDGKISRCFEFDKIEPFLNVKIKDTQLSKLLNISPDTLFPFQIPYVKNLKLYNANAVVNASADVRFKNIDDFSVKGKLRFDDVYIVSRPKNAETSFGECEFDGRNVFISVFAKAPNDALLTVFGKTKMKKMPYAEFSVKSYKPLDMEFAQSILIPLQKILALKLGPIPYMDLKGEGEIVLKTKGNKEKAELFGEFKTNNATVKMQGLSSILTNGSVYIKFLGSDIIFKDAKGLINGSNTLISGTADTSGNLNVDVNVADINSKYAMNVAKTSDIVRKPLNGAKFLDSFNPVSGNIDFYLNISGNIPSDAVFGEQSDSVFAKGKILFKGVNLYVEPKIKADNLKGVLTFNNNAEFDLTSDIYNSPFKIKGTVEPKIKNGKIDNNAPSLLNINFVSDKILSSSVGQFLDDNIELFIPENRPFTLLLAKMFNKNKFNLIANVNTKGEVDQNADTLDLSGFDFSGDIQGVNYKGSDFYFAGGKINLDNKKAVFDNLKITMTGINFLMDGYIDKFASNKPYNDLKLTFQKGELKNYVNFISKLLPEKSSNIVKNFGRYRGSVEGKIKLRSDKITGAFFPQGVSFVDLKSDIPVNISDGGIKIKNDKTYFDGFNLLYGSTPVYFDGFIQTQGQNPEFNIFASTNIDEASCDRLINPYLQYPLLLSGESTVKGRIKGRLNSYTTYFSIVLNEGSDLSFMGLKFGDVRQKREISSKIRFFGNSGHIDYIRYFKYISSQNNKQTPYDLINVKGGVKLNKGNLVLNNLKLYTPNPAPVRFLNILFKKSLIKDGLFTSDLVLNGPVDDFITTGNINFSNVIVPMYESVIDDIKIVLNNKEGIADFKLFSFNTNADVKLNFENKLSLPVVINNVSVHSDSISIDNLMKAFSSLASTSNRNNSSIGINSMQNTMLTPSDIHVKKGSIAADKVLINNIEGENLKLDFSHSTDTSLKIDNASINIAGGSIKGNGSYKFDTGDVFVSSDIIDCDANELTKAFFNVDGQIYGSANGNVKLSINDFSSADYVKKINADVDFEIIKGRLPKLGSIEYLLRASNFFKSGLFGMTLNNVIDLLTPYKHGDFNKITGYFTVKDATIKGLKIYSQGDNLSTYTYGNYDILAGIADIEILGKLSKKVSSLLGPVGNASIVSILNTLTRNKVDELVKTEMLKNVNKVPLIDLKNDDFRLFNAKIQGEINADNIVKSFNWLN